MRRPVAGQSKVLDGAGDQSQMARVVDLDDHSPAIRVVSREGVTKTIHVFGLSGRRPFVHAAVAGVIADIAKYCIESGLAQPVDTVVAAGCHS